MARTSSTRSDAKTQPNGSPPVGPPQSIDDPRVIRDVQQYVTTMEEGKVPDRESLVKRYPQIAEELAACLDALAIVQHVVPQLSQQAVEGVGSAADQIRPLGPLGDFSILREIGRGGMGVVYEAEQISLGRRVALKLFPFAAILDPRRLQRFKNEAQAAASLDHPNIVQVHWVGCERGVHYYAMQYIEGQTLAELIDELRQCSHAGHPDEVRDRVAGAERSGAPDRQPEDSGDVAETSPIDPAAETTRSPQAAISTEGSTSSTQFFHSAANLGVQAARALEHAHQMGVVHRDIKPSNLMLGTQGHLSITDFGLAMTQSDTNLTVTGDVLGTLRYMSPEQVQAKHAVLDHRTDVYSLGLTLYELLTLQPAFGGDDRRELMRQIVEQDPRPPRRLNESIPRDLETIVLKAIAKEPRARYDTAGELADDLQRFLEDRPIRARRPSMAERTAKWARRHRLAVWSGVGLLAVTIVGLTISTLLISQAYRSEEAQRNRAEENLTLALEAVDEIYLDFGEDAHLEVAYLDLAAGERRVRPKQITPEAEKFLRKAMAFYERFARTNRGEPSVRYETAKAYARVGAIRSKLGMYDRAEAACSQAVEISKQLVSEFPDVPRYQECLARGHVLRGGALFRERNFDRAMADFTEAIRLDADYAAAYANRGACYVKTGRFDRAIAECDRAIRLSPNSANAYTTRGTAYAKKRMFDRAVADYDKAIQLDPHYVTAYSNRAAAQKDRGKPDQAIVDYTEALRHQPKNPNLYAARGLALIDTGNLDQAIADCTKAIGLDPKFALAYLNRGIAHQTGGKLDPAIADYDKALELDPKCALAYMNRGGCYWGKGKPQQALADLGRSIQLDPNNAEAFYNRGTVHGPMGKLDLAIADFDEAVRLDPQFASAFNNRAIAHSLKGNFAQAIADYGEAMRIEPRDLSGCNGLARLLATCPDDQFRDVKRAVELATEAVKLLPQQSAMQNTLGVAQYRAGNWPAAIEALEKSVELGSGGGATDWLFLAMAHWQMDNKDEARRWYNKADQWQQKNRPDDEELRRFYAEAAELLGPEKTEQEDSTTEDLARPSAATKGS